MYEDVLKILQSQPGPPNKPELTISRLTLESVAHTRLHNFPEAERRLQAAEGLCRATPDASCGELIQARGLMELEQGQFAQARHSFELSLEFSRAHSDRFLESTSLLNMGAVSLREERFDEAIDSADGAFKVATGLGAEDVALVAQGNVGWAYYKLGDLENALDVFRKAEAHAAQLGDIFDQENELTNLGYVYLDEGKFDEAALSFRKALELARGINSKEDIHNALRVLSRLALRSDDIKAARQYAEQALTIARESGNRADELYPMLVLGQVAAQEGSFSEAEVKFRSVEQDPNCPAFLKWDAGHALARLYEGQANVELAQHEYRSALATFEGARESVRHEHYQLSFLTNGWRIYDDYLHFLISQGKTAEALRWADFSRARTLADGLGLLQKKIVSDPPPLSAPEIARRAKGVLMFYWLGEKQSYLWVVTGQKVTLFTLPPAARVNASVQRYVAALKNGPDDPLEAANSEGQSLYKLLIAPAEELLRKDARVFIIPDGALNNLNFEALLVPGPKLHYWIEDATIASASSLRLLSASYEPARNSARSLLLIGDSVAPNNNYPELPKAAAQVEAVARHFSKSQRQTFERGEATPAAYLDSNPERFSYVHFVAHGTASRLSPLDSAIVLSKTGSADDSFKLYARDIVRHPLRAHLVTISACYGAGERNYSGEGLVGLSWAFLRAGAHNVVAALWDVTDTPAEQLMDKFYAELAKGAGPGDALRTAKLSLLHGGRFRNPFYWAPFQLYVGS
jgi:CHAT domain-containing protein/Tfp pilus assembly protein PilF